MWDVCITDECTTIELGPLFVCKIEMLVTSSSRSMLHGLVCGEQVNAHNTQQYAADGPSLQLGC